MKKKNNVVKEEHIVVTGVIIDCLPGSKFKVQLDEIDKTINCTISGKLRMNSIMLANGDKVEVKLSPYDVTNGIITWRIK